MRAAVLPCALLILALAVPGTAGEVPWHVYPPGAEIKSLPAPRDHGDFVALVFSRILGREPRGAERERWRGLLEDGSVRREEVILDLLDSEEFFLRQSFLTLLRRTPGEEELQVRLRFLREGGSRRDILRNLLHSQEYRSLLDPG
jgi:hypothetical protein